MSIIMIIYYLISAFLLAMLIWNFIQEDKSADKMLQYILIMIPLILRILRTN
jgi:RsiW-degrading membrane proteinase PrsW (M82 family)